MEQKEFLKTIQAYRRRLNLAAFIKYSVFALSVAVAAGILIQAAALLIPLYYVNFYTLFTLLSGEFAAITVWILRRISLKQAALTMDSFGFAERIVTACENLPQKGILVEMQRKDAMRQLRAHKDKIRIALLPSWKKLVLLLGLSAALTGLGLTPSAQKENAKEQHQLKAEAKEKVQEITEAVDSLVELGKKAEEITPEQQAALQQMIESLQSSLAEYQQAQSTEMMKAAESKLNYKYENISSDLYNMAQNLPSNASQMLTEEALQYMESMQQAAQQMQELNGSELAQGIPFSNGFNGKINQGDTAQGNNSGQNSGNDAAGSGASRSGGQNSGNGQSQDGGTGQGDSAGQGGETNQGDGTSQGDGTNQNGGTGQGSDSGDNGYNGQGQDNGEGSGGGRGTGSTNAEHDYVSVPNRIAEGSNLAGNTLNHEDSTYFRAQSGISWEGEHISHEAVIGSYKENAYEGIAAGKYPSGMEEIIKEYFASF